jgi:hypothetical protein
VVSRVDCLPLRGVQGGQPLKAQTIFAGSMATDCGTPVAIQPQFLTFTNKATENAPNLSGPVVAPPPLVVLQIITAGATPTTAPIPAFFTPAGPSPLAGSPPSFGRDIQVTPPPAAPILAPLSPQ